MVMVDVFYPALNRSFEFSLATELPIGALTAEMLEIVSRTERLPPNADASEMLLCDLGTRRILAPNMTLEHYDIANGARLMLV